MVKTKPSDGGKKVSTWPKASFFAVRVVQIVLAIVPAAVAGWFVAALKEAKYDIPWQFSIIFVAVRGPVFPGRRLSVLTLDA